jgi:hypothetical protein
MAKSIKIVYYSLCHTATRFCNRPVAETAAEAYSKQAGYPCEAFYCEKEQNATGKQRGKYGPCWHVRWWRQGNTPLVAPTGDPGRQFQSSSVTAEVLDRAMNFSVDELLQGIPQ